MGFLCLTTEIKFSYPIGWRYLVAVVSEVADGNVAAGGVAAQQETVVVQLEPGRPSIILTAGMSPSCTKPD